MASSLTPTVPVIFPSCQLLITPLIKVALQGNGSFVARELICSCCSFPALNPNPQLGTLQLATAEPGTVSRRIRAPFGGDLEGPGPGEGPWLFAGWAIPSCSPQRMGMSLRAPQPRSPQPASSGVPADLYPCAASVPPGYFWGAPGQQTLNRPPPRTPSLCRQTQGGLPRGRVASHDGTTGTKMGWGGPRRASTHIPAHRRCPPPGPCVPRRGN